MTNVTAFIEEKYFPLRHISAYQMQKNRLNWISPYRLIIWTTDGRRSVIWKGRDRNSAQKMLEQLRAKMNQQGLRE